MHRLTSIRALHTVYFFYKILFYKMEQKMNAKFGLFLAAWACGGLAGCGENDLFRTSCFSSSECDYPRQICAPQGVCVSNPSYNPNPGPTLGQKCITDAECTTPAEKCKNKICTAVEQKECYNDTDCRSKYGNGYICTSSRCIKEAEPPKPQLSFKVTYGKNAGQFSFTQSWRAIIGQYAPKPDLYVLFCQPEDTTCKNPVKTLKLRHGTDYNDPVQASHGPTIELSDLTPGEYTMIVFADSDVSRAAGLGYDDIADIEQAYRGISESDMVVSEDGAKDKVNPPITPKNVNIPAQGNGTLDLGTLTLAHFFERDVSTHPQGENARLVVGISSGLRVIDLNEYRVMPVVEGRKEYTFQLFDASGNAYTNLCGLAKASEDLVWALYRTSGNGLDGYAVPFNPKTLKQIGSKRVEFPSIQGGFPCKGIAHHTDTADYLFVANYPGPENASEGLWSVHVNDVLLDIQNVTARAYNNQDDKLFAAGSYALAAYQKTLFSLPVPSDKTARLSPCEAGSACVFKFEIQEDGALTIAQNTSGDTPQYDILHAGNITEDIYTAENGERLQCTPNKFSNPSMGLGEYQDNAYLFVSRCHDMVVFDLTQTDTPAVDFDDALPGRQNLATYPYGQFMHAFRPSPDKSVLWAVAANSSLVKLFATRVEADGNEARVSYDRLAAMPIDLSGPRPALHLDYATQNIDNFEGKPSLDAMKYLSSPAIDPGLDLTNFWFQQYLVKLYPSLQGSTPYFTVTAPKLAVGTRTLWIGNTSTAGSGANFGQYNDFAVYDLEAQRGVFWPQSTTEYFYHVFTSGVTNRLGFPLTPDADKSLESFDIVYIDMSE